MFRILTVACRGWNRQLGGFEQFFAATNHFFCITYFGYAQYLINHHSSFNSLEIWELEPQRGKKWTSRSGRVSVEWVTELLSGVTRSEITVKRWVLRNISYDRI
jgi:hypothetical protein